MEDEKKNGIINENADLIIDTSNNKGDGQIKCPGCGASEITLDTRSGMLRCGYCGTEFKSEESNEIKDISSLKGRVVGSSAVDIKEDVDSVVTMKCSGCGAEIVVDTKEAVNARCHWCRSVLSINNKIENGSFPDLVLPFCLEKHKAEASIKKFVNDRKSFANPTFSREFTTRNVMGVYFPYMLVDANCHAKFEGFGEHQIRSYSVKNGDNETTYYDADCYRVGREFDIAIDDLTIESSATRLDKSDDSQTNNVINAILPFDTENAVKYESNFLTGFTSERRDVNVDQLDDKVSLQLKDVTRHSANDELKFYDRGVCWKKEEFSIIGTQWMSAYLPVWLYSYQEVTGDKKILHYVAVNGRNGKVMGSVPINMPKLIGVSCIVEVAAFILSIILTSALDIDGPGLILLALIAGFAYFFFIYSKYRNKGARHVYEKATKHTITNLVSTDELYEHRNRLTDSTIDGMNNNDLQGEGSLKIKK